MAQSGRVLGSGPRGRWFESSHSDEKTVRIHSFYVRFRTVFCFCWIDYSDISTKPSSMPLDLPLEQSRFSNEVLMNVQMILHRGCSKNAKKK